MRGPCLRQCVHGARVLVAVLALTLCIVRGADICDQSYMGRMKSGLITSDNYPFNYRLQSQCRHRIYLYDDGPVGEDKAVCFTFHRFQLEYSAACRDAYLQFPGAGADDWIRYCGEGTWHKADPTHDTHSFSNIFTENLCWLVDSTVGNTVFDIEFRPNFMNYKGYYGRFEIHDVLASVPPDSYLVTGTGIEGAAAHLPLLPATHTLLTPMPCPRVKCPEECKTEFVKSQGCLVCVCAAHGAAGHNDVADTPTLKQAGPPCLPDEYTCFCRECIPDGLLCDGVDNCSDGSDEDFVHARCPGARQSIAGCNLESGPCDFTLRNMLLTKLSYGGPRYDHTYNFLSPSDTGGHFIMPSYTTELTADMTYSLVPIHGTKDSCLSFWYFMSGLVGTLSVYVRVEEGGEDELVKPPAWWREDNYGNTWRQGEIDIPRTAFPLLEVKFHTIKGDDSYSHIAIDDISLSDGPCFRYDPSCTFELGWCGWVQGLADGGEGALWDRRRGPGDQPTGPDGDARTGDGYYMYVPASKYPPGTAASLISRPITFNPHTDNLYCVQLAYHMGGRSGDVLEVWAWRHDSRRTLLGSVSGGHGDAWHKLQLAITSTSVSGPFQLWLRAVVGNSTDSDIAVDDVIITQGTCLTYTPPASTPGPGLSTPPPLQCPPGYWLCDSGDECIQDDRLCDGRLDCTDLSDEKNCGVPSHSVGLWLTLAVGTVVILVVVISVVLYKFKYKHYDDPPPTRYPPHFFMDSQDPQVFTEDFDEIPDHVYEDLFDDNFQADPPPPYSGGPSLPSYTDHLPPPLYSPGPPRRCSGDDACSSPHGASTSPPHVGTGPPDAPATLTVSLTYPHEPPPSYEIAIVTTAPSADTSRLDRTHDSIPSQVAVRISRSRSGSRSTLTDTRPEHSRAAQAQQHAVRAQHQTTQAQQHVVRPQHQIVRPQHQTAHAQHQTTHAQHQTTHAQHQTTHAQHQTAHAQHQTTHAQHQTTQAQQQTTHSQHQTTQAQHQIHVVPAHEMHLEGRLQTQADFPRDGEGMHYANPQAGHRKQQAKRRRGGKSTSRAGGAAAGDIQQTVARGSAAPADSELILRPHISMALHHSSVVPGVVPGSREQESADALTSRREARREVVSISQPQIIGQGALGRASWLSQPQSGLSRPESYNVPVPRMTSHTGASRVTSHTGAVTSQHSEQQGETTV